MPYPPRASSSTKGPRGAARLPDADPLSVHRRTPRSLVLHVAVRVALPLLGFWIPLTSCGRDSGTEPGGTLALSPERGLAVGIGDHVTFSASRIDPSGRPAPPPPDLEWMSTDPSVATVSSAGVAAAVGPGLTTIRISAPTLGSASAALEVYIPPEDEGYEPGRSYLGRQGYTEYRPGTLPVILSAPHGGDLVPDEIPDRTYGTTGMDGNTLTLAEAIADAFFDASGERPHVVLSHLMRIKLDPNREIVEAAQGSRAAELAWAEYHGFIDAASDSVESIHGSGLYLDLHGHGHAVQRIELGYLLSGAELDLSDGDLNAPRFAARSSIRALAEASPLPFSELLRGPDGFGSLLRAEGYPSVPSDADPGPAGDPYFGGQYSTARHGSRDGGTVDGIQVEHYRLGIRDTPENRAAYGQALARVVTAYLNAHTPAGAPSR